MPTRTLTLDGTTWRVFPSGRVTQYDRKTQRVTASIKQLEVAEEKEAIAQYGSSDSGATLGDILGTALKGRAEKDENKE